MEDIGIDGKIILEWIVREMGWEGANWVHLAQSQWDLVNMVMSLCVP
jgi:hypothetical protein